MGCVFCAIARGEERCVPIYEDEATLAFLDIGAATPGHTLVIPRRHADDLWVLNQDDAMAVIATAQRVAMMLRATLAPPGLNLVHSSGAMAGQDVLHFHLHVVPRYSRDGWTSPWSPSHPSWDELEVIGETVRAANPG